MRKIELLSPAKDAMVGIEAFNHGADAVYIGAPKFGARQAVGNNVSDIEHLAAYGHRYGGRTFVAMNTILTDDELREAEQMAWQLYEAGADALIIQDLGLLKMHMPPIELHASTQTDNRTPEKARLLKQLGFKRVVVARELSIDQIRDIHNQVDVDLECFVHGALCVSYSGQCYLSAALTGRSANRGACAQPCRLPMDLLDADGRVLVSGKHLLSLKDMNRSADLEQLVDAGVLSLKIEGRLKDVDYVKNVTAYYRQKIDALLAKHGDWQSLSDGRCTYAFTPRPEASFNRGFTNYYLYGGRDTEQGRKEVIWNIDTPKSMGEKIGNIQRLGDQFLVLDKGSEQLHNGDGLFAKSDSGEIIGFRLNKNDLDRNKLFPASGASVVRSLKRGMEVYRNLDYQFEQMLQKTSAMRKVPVDMVLSLSASQVVLKVADDHHSEAQIEVQISLEKAQKTQRENYNKQLAKLGDTIYELRKLTISTDADMDYFIPSSMLAEWRRKVCTMLDEVRLDYYKKQYPPTPVTPVNAESINAATVLSNAYTSNVLNQKAAGLYAEMKVENVASAFERKTVQGVPLMFTTHCIKYALGQCPKYQHPTARWKEPLALKIGDKKFILKFGCKNACISEIISIFATPNKH